MSDFVNFKLAQKLKDKGFDWVKITTYNPKTKVRNNHLEPTISQVLKWLRDEKKIHICIDIYDDGWFFDIASYYKEDTGVCMRLNCHISQVKLHPIMIVLSRQHLQESNMHLIFFNY